MGREFERSMKDQAARDELLSAYLDDQLDAGDRARLEAQLAANPALRTELEALRHTVALVREMPQQSIPRNFILPQATAVASRPVPAAHPRRRWLAPFLTAATAAVSLLFIAVLTGDLLFSGGGGMAQFAAPKEERAVMAPSPAEGTAGEKEAENALSITESPAEEAPPEAPPGLGPEETPAPNAEAPVAPSPQPTPLPEMPDETLEAGDGDWRYAESTPEAEESPGPAEVGGGGEPPAESPVPTSVPTTGEVADSAASTDTPESKEGAPVPLPATVEPTERTVHDTGPAPDDEAGPPAEGKDEGGRSPVLFLWSAPWRAIEIALGVAALLLALAMVWAWRARRR